MKFANAQRVDGTSVTIGRRVVRTRLSDGTFRETVLSTYTAEYTEDGKRRVESLRTANVREARRRAWEIERQLTDGVERPRCSKLLIETLLDRFAEQNQAKGLCDKTLAKYNADISKLRRFCAAEGITRADRFGENEFYRFCAWLRDATHKQGTAYAPKTILTCATICVQAFRWAHRTKLLRTYPLAAVRLPRGDPKPQPCPTIEEVERIVAELDPPYNHAVLIAAYAGLRANEIVSLRWEDIEYNGTKPTTICVRRGGSSDAPKDREHRFIPVNERLTGVLAHDRRGVGSVLPGLRDRTMLARVQRAARTAGIPGRITMHGFRHFFASFCANNGVPVRLCLSWMGHQSSETFLKYFHQSDAESAAAMAALSQRTLDRIR